MGLRLWGLGAQSGRLPETATRALLPAMPRIDVRTVVTESFAFIRAAWSGAPGALAAAMIVDAGAQAFGGAIAVWAVLPQILVAALGTGALYRIALGADRPRDGRLHLGPAGLQWGGVEWRVLGANLLVGLILAPAVLLLFLIWAAGLGYLTVSHQIDVGALTALRGGDPAAMRALMSGPAGPLTAAILLPGAAALIWLAARLALVPIAAADVQRFDVGQAWTLTREAAWPLIVVALIVILLQIAAGLFGGLVGGFLAALAGGAKVDWPAATALAGAIGTAAAVAIGLPITAGAAAFVYRMRRDGG